MPAIKKQRRTGIRKSKRLADAATKAVQSSDFMETQRKTGNSPSKQYKHREMSHDEIRLLRFLPGNTGDELHLEIATFSRSQLPSYTALSYTWLTPCSGSDGSSYALSGDWDESAPTQTILIGPHKQTYPVGNNLWCFLQRIRCDLAGKYFWADALCIQQSDIVERNRQVHAMGDTYRDAMGVAVWLGHSDRSTALAFTPWDDIHHESQPVPGQEIQMLGSVLFQRWPHARNHPMLSAFCAVWSLGLRPYWTRAWITQEVLLAKAVTLYCGGFEMSWSRFEANLHRAAAFASTTFHLDGEFLKHCPAARIAEIRDLSISEGNWSFSSLIARTYDKSSSDPRDKVFALLGLLSDEERDALRPSLPDYCISQISLFSQIVHHVIAWSGRTATLNIIEKLLQLLNVPVYEAEMLGGRAYARVKHMEDPTTYIPHTVSQERYEASLDVKRFRRLHLSMFPDGSATMQTVWDVIQDACGLARVNS